MNIFHLGIYAINELFSFLEYKKRLQICKISKRLLKILYIKKASFKLYNFLINSFAKYNISSLNLQNIYEKTFEYFKKDLEAKEINLIISYFLHSLPKNHPVKEGMIKLNPLFKNYHEFLNIDCQDFVLKFVSLYDIPKNNLLKNEKITSLDINFTVSSSMEKEIPIISENLNYLLSLNQYKNIQIIIVGEEVFTQDSFDYINLDKLEKLQLSYMNLSSKDIIYFLTNIYESYKKYPLISLDLSSNTLDDECTDLLCQVIENNFLELKKINLHGNNFTSIGAEKILHKFHKTLEIDIALNKLLNGEIDLFNKYNNSAKELKIISNFRFHVKNDFQDNTLEQFYNKYKDLKYIELYENKYLSNEEDEYKGIQKPFKNISSCLNKMKKIEKINFTGTYNAGNILEECDNSFLEQIKDYSISFCKISKKSIEITEKMKNLEDFSCFKAALKYELMTNLINSLKNNTNLTRLSLSHADLDSKSVELLINSITNMKHLLRFSIDENYIGVNSIIQIINSLSANCHDLSNLNISKTIEPHTKGLKELWDSLTNIYNLNQFICQDNHINSKDMLLLKDKLSNNFIMLNKINFSYNADIDTNVLNDFLPVFKKYFNHVEALALWGVGIISKEDIIKFRNIFPGRIRIRNTKNNKKKNFNNNNN